MIAPHVPKIARFGLGAKIEQSFISTLEMIHQAIFSPADKKLILIDNAITRLDTLSFFLQIAWENKLIHETKYLALAEKLNEVGKNLGGWRKFIIANNSKIKTPK